MEAIVCQRREARKYNLLDQAGAAR